MSYTVMNKNLDMFHTYVPSKTEAYVPGIWWPDHGNNCPNLAIMNPTNTMFKNAFEKGKAQSSTGPQLMQDASLRDVAPLQQIRHPMPATEALYKSTIIQPYKSGGRLPNGKESGPIRVIGEPPLLSAARQSFNASMTLSPADNRSMRMNRSASDSAMRSMKITEAPTPRSDSGASVIGAPSWIANQTFMSRQGDAAGQAGTTVFKHHYKGSPKEEGELGRTLASSRTISGTLIQNSSMRR